MMTNSDYSVFNLPRMLAKSKSITWQREVLSIFENLAFFLQKNKLVSKTYVVKGKPIDKNAVIMNSELTELGSKVVWEALDKWYNGHDRGKPIEDMWAFEKALKKYS